MADHRKFTEDEERTIALIATAIADKIEAAFAKGDVEIAAGTLRIAGLAVPSFWLGMVIILLLLTYFSWIPPLTFTSFLEDPLKNLSNRGAVDHTAPLFV